MIVLWNTIYMEAVLEQFRKEGYPVNEEDKAKPRVQQYKVFVDAPIATPAG